MSKLIRVVFAVVVMALMASCQTEESADVNQDRIWTWYELVYNAETDKSFARAQFKFGNALGTLLELSEPSQVTFDGGALSFKKVPAWYEADFAGNKQSGTFTWHDTEGTSYTNSISIPDIDFPAGFTSMDKGSAYTLEWEGDALGPNEYVGVFFNGNFEQDASISWVDDNGANAIIIPKNKIDQLADGKVDVWLERGVKPGLTEKTSAGGEIWGKYRTYTEVTVQ